MSDYAIHDLRSKNYEYEYADGSNLSGKKSMYEVLGRRPNWIGHETNIAMLEVHLLQTMSELKCGKL